MLEHEIAHLGLSLVAGLIVYQSYKKWSVLIAALFSGFLIDADHLIDYLLYKKVFAFDLVEFLGGKFFDITNRVYILFHGYEYAIIFLAIGMVILLNRKFKDKKGLAFISLSLGISLFFHLIFDTISYKPKWPAYSITYRLYQNFDHDQLGFK